MKRGFWLGPWYVDLLQQVATRGEERVALSANEAALLTYLQEHAEHGPVSREKLLVEVFQYAPGVQSRAVDMGLSRLRRKLEADPKNAELVLARRGVGVYLEQLHDGPPTRNVQPPPPGRGDLVTAVQEVLDGGSLATLVGPSGIGKSSVARHLHAVRGGVWVGLLNQLDVDGLDGAVASALQCNVGDIEERLSSLELVVLDNFEQLDEAAARRVQGWSEVCPVLVTSVRPLRISSEQVVVVPELDVATAAGVLIEHAGQAGVVTSEEQARQVVEVVGGHPLALVLLAPSIGLVGELDPALLLQLDSDRADHPVRHRSLNAALDRALNLTTAEARRTLADLSVFALRFEPWAVKAVGGPAALLALRELMRWGLVQQTGDFLQLPPVVALHARQLERSEGLQERFWAFLLSLGERLFVEGLPEGGSPYIEDVLAGLTTIDADRVFALGLVASQLKPPRDRLCQLLAARSRPVAHDEAFSALQVVIDFGSPLRTEVLAMEPNDPVVACIHYASRFNQPGAPPLSAAAYRALRGTGHPQAWPAVAVALGLYLEPSIACAVLDEEISISRNKGWEAHTDALRACKAQSLFQLGAYSASFTLLRDIDADRLTMTAQIYLVAGACALGLLGVARTSVEQLLAAAERVGWPHDVFRAKVLIACVTFLSGEPSLEAAEDAVGSAGGSLSPRWGQLGLLVHRLETGSTEPVGQEELDVALVGGPLPVDRRTIGTLARLMFTREGA